MIVIKAKNTIDAWRHAFSSLMNSSVETENEKYFRDEPFLIEIEYPDFDIDEPLFPMSFEDIKYINNYIVSGNNEESVVHDWTKIYYHRIFDEPNSQFKFLLAKLQTGLPVGEAQISMWDKLQDQNAKVSPCTQILWARIKNGTLEWHTHAHSSDAYKKLLMNLEEFIALQYFVAKQLNVKVGKYYHFLDSCHIHYKDLDKAKELLNKLS